MEAFHLVEFKGVLNGFFLAADGSPVLQNAVQSRIKETIEEEGKNRSPGLLVPPPELVAQFGAKNLRTDSILRKE